MSRKTKAKKIVKHSIKAVIEPRSTAKSLKSELARVKTAKNRYKSYKTWFSANQPDEAELAKQRKTSRNFAKKPLISILIPIYNTNEAYFRECLDSVIAQTYDNWELCVADDASTTPIVEVVKEYKKKYGAKSVDKAGKHMHIAGASNEALKLAKGEFIALLDHDDILLPNALYEMASMLNQHPQADFIYSDEDKIEEGKGHLEPFFKPDWSPDFLHSCNYITHFAVLKHSLMKEICGFTLGTEGAQDWDLFLRITQKTNNIFHVPKIIYSWRKSPTSTAKNADSKPYAYIKQRSV